MQWGHQAIATDCIKPIQLHMDRQVRKHKATAYRTRHGIGVGRIYWKGRTTTEPKLREKIHGDINSNFPSHSYTIVNPDTLQKEMNDFFRDKVEERFENQYKNNNRKIEAAARKASNGSPNKKKKQGKQSWRRNFGRQPLSPKKKSSPTMYFPAFFVCST